MCLFPDGSSLSHPAPAHGRTPEEGPQVVPIAACAYAIASGLHHDRHGRASEDNEGRATGVHCVSCIITIISLDCFMRCHKL